MVPTSLWTTNDLILYVISSISPMWHLTVCGLQMIEFSKRYQVLTPTWHLTVCGLQMIEFSMYCKVLAPRGT